jgi:predicted nucleotidyltransferase
MLNAAVDALAPAARMTEMSMQDQTGLESDQASIRPNRGIFANEDAALKAVVSRLVERLDPLEIWLFGSRSEIVGGNWSRARPDSDFDLMVVLRDETALGDDYLTVARPLYGLGVGCDVIPVREVDYKELANDPTTFTFHIIGTGRRLYKRANGPH